ncbi:hypothetical protein BC827DRAFT_1166633 [Russula dissimulans]|nr:hypothetical protein BC827DRAFT_1166633 [Russula dissimulans]
MDPVPISPYTINLILQYISPPSQLSAPLPSHLLSRSLLQRHALLEISPEDSSSYLCWPSSARDRAVQYLESLRMPLDELAPDFLVGYALDPEHAYAHVHVKPTGDDGLRLVFEWDGEAGWKYHDSNVMPFPPAACPTLDEAVVGTASVSVPVLESDGDKQDKGGNVEGDSNDGDDDYWNSYGAADESGTQPLQSSTKDETDASEDAYWAQYASVQGTADSTVPSPIHKRTRRLEAAPVVHYIPHEEIIPIRNADTRSRHYDPKAPPSPTTLTHRLTVLSLRHSNTSPLVSDGLPEPDHEDILGATDDDTESPSSLPDDESPLEWGTLQRNGKDRAASSTMTTDSVNSSSSRQGINEDHDTRALQDAVRGLYFLWKTTRQGSRSSPGGEGQTATPIEELDRADFLQLVGGAIAAPK